MGAVVLPSLFEEQIRAEADRDERLAEVGVDSFGEAMTYLIDPGRQHLAPASTSPSSSARRDRASR